MQVLLRSDIRKYFSSFFITAVAVVFISLFISAIEHYIFLWMQILMLEKKLT